MEIKIDNIGIIKQSNIKINGLTVITGHNNSGKSTLGKVLYALVDSVANLKKVIDDNRQKDFREYLDQIRDKYFIFRFLLTTYYRYDSADLENENKDEELFRRFVCNKLNNKEIANPSKTLDVVLRYLRSNKVLKIFDNVKLDEQYSGLVKSLMVREVEEIYKNVIELSTIEKEYNENKYVGTILTDALCSEFKGQIQPVRVRVDNSKIIIDDNGTAYYDVEIVDNKVVASEGLYTAKIFERAILIDDLYVVDDYNPGYSKPDCNHNLKLKNYIFKKARMSPQKREIVDAMIEKVMSKVSSVLPGEIERISGSQYYVDSDVKLRLENLATGSKMFSIMKQLLAKGFVDNKTLLILDEPEAHLHPEWQNIFAEIVVLLVKELGTRVVLTSHSTNFVLALDAYRRKHNLGKDVSFYQTKQLDAGMVGYVEIKDDLEEIYADYFKYLLEVKALRDSYLYK